MLPLGVERAHVRSRATGRWRHVATLVLFFLVARGVAEGGSVLLGKVVGVDLQPIAGATIEVMREGSPGCSGQSQRDGTFAVSCEIEGSYPLRVSQPGMQTQTTEPLPIERLPELTFVLLPEAPLGVSGAPAAEVGDGGIGAWLSAPLPNAVMASVGGYLLTARALGVAGAIALTLSTAFLVLFLGPRLGVRARRLSAQETGDLIFNQPLTPAIRRVQTVATLGATGTAWSMTYGVPELAAMIRAQQHALLLASLASPMLVGGATLGFLTAMLVEQPRYLFLVSLVIPTCFILMPVVFWLVARREPTR